MNSPADTTAPTNAADSGAAIQSAVAALLRTATTESPTVVVTGVASVGAIRSTVFVDITDTTGVTTPAVAQVSASAATFENPMTVEDEGALITLAAEAGLPVAPLLAANASAPVVDAPILVCGRIDGETIPRRVLRLLDAHPGAGDHLAAECGRALARLHAVDAKKAPAGLTHLDPTNPALAYVDSLKDSLESLGTPYPALRYGLNWLREHPPSVPTDPALIHADFRTGNLIIGPPEGDAGWLRAVLDWEVAHVGDPMEDLAYLCLRTWRFGNDHQPVGGFGSLNALRDAYIDAGGEWRQDAFDWWTIARTIWWGIGLAAQAANFVRGATTTIIHAASGRRVVELEYDALNLIKQHGETTHGL